MILPAVETTFSPRSEPALANSDLILGELWVLTYLYFSYGFSPLALRSSSFLLLTALRSLASSGIIHPPAGALLSAFRRAYLKVGRCRHLSRVAYRSHCSPSRIGRSLQNKAGFASSWPSPCRQSF